MRYAPPRDPVDPENLPKDMWSFNYNIFNLFLDKADPNGVLREITFWSLGLTIAFINMIKKSIK